MRRERARVFAGAAAIYSRPLRSPPGALSFGALLQSFFLVGAARTERVRPPRGRRPLRSWATRHSLTHSPGRLHPNSRLCVRPQPRPTDARIRQHPFFATTDGGGISGVVFDGCCTTCFPRNMVFERVVVKRLVSDLWYLELQTFNCILECSRSL